MTNKTPRIKSELYQLRLEALQAEFLQTPHDVLCDATEALKQSLVQHGLDSHPEISADANWLIQRMEELIDALRCHDDPMTRGDNFYCRFERRRG